MNCVFQDSENKNMQMHFLPSTSNRQHLILIQHNQHHYTPKSHPKKYLEIQRVSSKSIISLKIYPYHTKLQLTSLNLTLLRILTLNSNKLTVPCFSHLTSPFSPYSSIIPQLLLISTSSINPNPNNLRTNPQISHPLTKFLHYSNNHSSSNQPLQIK